MMPGLAGSEKITFFGRASLQSFTPEKRGACLSDSFSVVYDRYNINRSKAYIQLAIAKGAIYLLSWRKVIILAHNRSTGSLLIFA